MEPPRKIISSVRKAKRKRKDDPVEQFIEMLIEAVDRNEARECIEESLQQIDEWTTHDYKTIEELSCRVKFLEPIAVAEPHVPALERVLAQHKGEIAKYRAEMENNTEKEEMLRRRLTQSSRELAELLRQIFDASDGFLNALDETGTLGAFHDDRGNLKEGVVVPKAFASGLRMAADRSRLFISNRKNTDQTHKEWMTACNAARASASPAQRSRRRKPRSEKFKVWHREEKDQKLQTKLQEEREKDLLTGVVWDFLVANNLVIIERGVSDESSEEGAERTRADPQRSPRSHQEYANDSAHRAAVLQPWLTDRRDLLRQRKHLEMSRELYDKELAEHLYAYPRSTKADFDVMHRKKAKFDQEENERVMTEAIEDIANDYTATREAARADVRNLLLSPDWAASANDVEPSLASTLAPYLQSPRLDPKRREVRRYGRDVARRVDLARNPSTSPTSPSSKNLLPSHSGDLPWDGVDTTTLGSPSRKRRVRHMSAVAANLRAHFDRAQDGPTYIRSPVMTS